MNKIFTLYLILPVLFFITPACNEKQDSQAPAMESFIDSVAYAVGMDIYKFYHKQGVDLNPDMIYAGLNDMRRGDLKLSSEEAVEVVNKYQLQQIQLTAASNKIEGDKFLEANASKEGIVSLATGLQYKVLQSGKGPSPKPDDLVRVHYTGKFTNGTVFASSRGNELPAEVKVDGLLPGWIEALLQMKEGDKWEIFLPADLAYGAEGYLNPTNQQVSIPPNAVLIYEIELIEIL